MKLLEDRIVSDGIIMDGDVLKVDRFLNHQMDVFLFSQMAEEWFRLFEGARVNKILTIEASGIGLACVTALKFGCPVVFAKKSKTSNQSPDVYHAPVHSYTHGTDHDVTVSREYLLPTDKVLLIDDFLANGEALAGLVALCRQAGAEVVGAGIAIEKAYQPGGQRIRDLGIRVESLARIRSMDLSSGIQFC